MAVNLQPVRIEMRKVDPRFWPSISPVFVEPHAPGDCDLARALFQELDLASKWQYWKNAPDLFGDLGPIPEPQRGRD